MESKLKNKINLNFKRIILALLFLEIIGCYYAYYTLGEVKMFFCILILLLNIIPFVLYLFRIKIISFVIGVIIGLILIPYQTFFLVRWLQLKKESSMIVEYIYHYEETNGEFPKSISDYEFENHKLISNFSYNTGSKGFGLRYYVGTKGTTHFYFHNVGRWAYYPD